MTDADRDRSAAALGAYRSRALDLREELVEAQSCNDPERISRTRHELERLAEDMARDDDVSSAAGERARINVTRAIKAAVRRIAEQEPELGHLLRGTVRTGTACTIRARSGSSAGVGRGPVGVLDGWWWPILACSVRCY